MTRQAHAVLAKLRKAQITENGHIFVDFDALTASTCHANGERCVIVKLSAYRNSLDSILDYLEKHDYIRRMRPDYCCVLHPGFHVWQTRWSNFCAFVGGSVLTPIIVTILTTLALRLLG